MNKHEMQLEVLKLTEQARRKIEEVVKKWIQM